MRPVAKLLGATEAFLEDSVLYGRTVIGFTTAFMLQNVFQSFLTVAEKPKLGLLITVIAGVTNAILDALFMAVFKWGLVGAAVATGIGQLVGGIIPIVYFCGKCKIRYITLGEMICMQLVIINSQLRGFW